MKKIAILTSIGGSQMSAINNWIEVAKSRGENFCEISKVIISHKDTKASEVAGELGLDYEIYALEDYDGYRKRWSDDIALAIFDVDLVCSCGFMYVLPPSFVNRHVIINIHPALLPLFPGLDTMKKTLDSGMRIAGCTAHFIDEGVDTGLILEQRTVDVWTRDDEDSLFERIMMEVWALWPVVIKNYFRGEYDGKKKKSNNN